MKKILLYTFLFFYSFSNAQLIVDNTVSPVDLVTNYLVEAGLNPFNIRFNTALNITLPRDQVSRFYTNNPTNLGIDKGIVMCTGKATSAVGPNSANGSTTPTANLINTVDPDLSILAAPNLLDKPVILEFDFVATGKELSFDFVFASEEYPEYSTSTFNDVFGFFISGPGITGPFSGNAKNIARIPTSTTGNFFVTMNNVNNGLTNTGPCTNCAYYVQNNLQQIQFDGFTKILTAKSALECGGTYHIKLAISNVSDNLFDSAVFIKNFSVPPLSVLVNGSSQNNVVVCTGGAANLTTGLPIANTRFEWLLGTTILPLETGPNLSTTIPGVYTVNAYTVPGNCKFATDTVTVSFAPTITTATPINFEICAPVATSYSFGDISQPLLLATIANLSDYEISYYDTSSFDANDGAPGFLTPTQVLSYTFTPATSLSLTKTIWIRIFNPNAAIPCPLVLPFTLKVETPPSGTFSYTAATYCNDVTTVVPITASLTSGGTYTATPAGLNINANTGVINPSLSLPNNYTITYYIAATATCPAYTAPTVALEILTCLAINNGPICLGTSVNLDVSISNPSATYTWTNVATSYNSGPLLGSALVAVTPTISGSLVYNLSVVAPSGNFTDATTVVVKPIPTVAVPSNPSYCVGDTVPVSGFTSAVTGTTYSWTSDTTAVGVSASGSGDVASFTATNATTAPIVATISVTPTANGCAGSVVTYTLTVNPKVTVVVPTSFNAYNAATVPASNFTSPSTGVTYAWTNSNTAIGLLASGNGDVPSFTATNAGTTDISGTITVTPSYGTCVGTPSTYTITVKPTPDVTVPSNTTYCITDTVPISNFTSAIAGTTYAWTNNNTAIGLVASGNVNVPSFVATNTTSAPIVATISVIPTASGLAGAAVTYTITVNPKPTVVVPTVAPVCVGATVALTNFTSPTTGVTYTWTNDTTAIGLLSTSGTGDVPSFTATNTTTSNLVATITVTPKIGNCSGTPSTYTITVKPTPNVVVPVNISYCVGNTVPASNLTSAVTGTTYAWTNSNTAIGLVASGTGDVPTFTAVNTTTAAIVATITVTPTANGCAGTAVAYTITVKPTPNVVVPPNASYCNGDTVPASNYTSNVSGTTYTWTNNTTAIGIAASGTGNIPSFTASNTTATPIVATIRVTPTADGCPGAVVSYTITINPTATVVVPASFDTYNTVVVAASNFTSTSAGATYTWTNSNTAIGLGASGNGNVPSFTATNTTTTNILGTITVTPSFGTCVGTPSTYTITVKPTPDVTVPSNNTYCITDTVPASNFMSPTPGTTYAWTNNNTAIGQVASGNGNVPPFLATNATTAPIVATISVIPTAAGIPGTAVTYTITVNPKVTVVVPTIPPVCAGTVVAITNFTSPTTGVTYSWTNNNTAIGLLSASGTGDVPSFTATNTTTSNLVATITVTPTIGTCVGIPSSYTITVKPIPNVVVPADNSYCDTFTVPASNFTSAVTGTTYAWTNSNTAIGLAASGTGNISNFLAVNTTTTAIVATITVTPTANGCSGIAKTYTITVNGKPLKPIQNGKISYCLGVTDASLSVTGTNLLWYTAMTGGTGSATVPTINTSSIGEKYFYVSQTINGCESDRLKITITIVAAPNLVITPNLPEAVCEPTTVNISGAVIAATSQPGVFSYWKDSAATNEPISPQEANAIAVSGTYYLKLTNTTGCYTIQPVTVTINPKPIVNLDQNGYVCTDKDGMVLAGSVFNLQTGLSTTIYSFKWYNDTNGTATAPIAGATASNYVATTPGNYRVEVTNISTTCPEITRTTVVASVAPDKIEFTKTSYFEDDKTIIVNATPASNYEYQLDNGIFQESNTFTGVTSGNHKIVVRDKYGCGQKEDTLRLLDFPKYFTPNGDGFNDTWNISDIKNEQPNAKIYIFDRLGKLLKQISPESGDWDGTINGTGLPADDYWFTVEYQEDNVAKIFKSHFSLKR